MTDGGRFVQTMVNPTRRSLGARVQRFTEFFMHVVRSLPELRSESRARRLSSERAPRVARVFSRALAVALAPLFVACGVDVQDLGPGANVAEVPPPTNGGSASKPTDPIPPAPGGGTWEWMHPSPQGNRIRGMGGSAHDDVWLVGDGNTALHWDGAEWSDRHGALRGLDLYSIWSSGPKNAWAIGDTGVAYTFNGASPNVPRYSRHVNDGGAILHYDGTAWTPDPSIGKRIAHAVWGADAANVFALLEGGEIGRFDGKVWTTTPSPNGKVLRDVWGTSATDVWAVGDEGTILHFDGAAWTAVPIGTGVRETDPAATTNRYYGVWGASANDVWAIFIDPSSITIVGDKHQILGFSHWDGTAWTVQQTVRAKPHDLYAYAPDTAAPLRVGHGLWGDGAGRILATSLGTSQLWSFDGAQWSAEPSPVDVTRRVNTVFATTASGGVLAAGEAGALFRYDDAAAADGRLVPLFPGLRDSLVDVDVVNASDAWAVAARQGLVRWSTGGWSPIRLTVATSWGETTLSPQNVSVANANDVWVIATYYDNGAAVPFYKPVAMHWNGAAWSRAPLPTEIDGAASLGAPTIEASKSGGPPMLLGSGKLYRWSGNAFVRQPYPDGAFPAVVASAAPNELWTLDAEASDGSHSARRWNGASFEEVFRVGGGSFNALHVAGPKDVWVNTGEVGIIGSGHASYHWDGTTVHGLHALDARTLWPAGNGGTYFLRTIGSKPEAGVSGARTGLYFFDGAKTLSLGETSADLRTVAGDPATSGLWFVGDGGATLRYRLGATPK